jgi:peptidoglycan/LPS O-acetylase OafA/YrhL
MGKFIAALLGVVSGFVIAHVLNETPEGRAFFARSRATIRTFTRGVQDAYRS